MLTSFYLFVLKQEPFLIIVLKEGTFPLLETFHGVRLPL